MAGRPRNFDENEIIRKASEIFWRKGYESSSAEELLEAMNMGKGSFYLHFKGGKQELYKRSLDLFSKESLERFHQGGREKSYSGFRPCDPGFILVAFSAENRNPFYPETAPACCWSMIFSENRYPLFGIML